MTVYLPELYFMLLEIKISVRSRAHRDGKGAGDFLDSIHSGEQKSEKVYADRAYRSPEKLSQNKIVKWIQKDRFIPREHVASAGASILMKKPPAQFVESAQFRIKHIEEGVSVNGIRAGHEDLRRKRLSRP
jgi:hypothetical protein